MGSTRLPGKTLAPVLGRPLLELMLDRVRSAEHVDTVVVATTTESRDDAVVDVARRAGVEVFRGSEQDVLARYRGAAEAVDAASVARLTSDCPLIAPDVIDLVVVEFLKAGGEVDLVTNAPPVGRTYPDGMDVEVFSRAALERAHVEAESAADREHVTRHFYDGNFRVREVHLGRPLGQVRLTVDEPEDLDRVRSIFETLRTSASTFGLDDVLDELAARGELVGAEP